MRSLAHSTSRFFIGLTFNILLMGNVNAADTLCGFRAKGLSLSFGLIDPSVVQDISRPITVQIAFADQAGDCKGAGSMVISLVGSTSRQLVSGSNRINYSVSGFPIALAKPGNAPPGNPANGYVRWFAPAQLQGTILWSAYADAPVGNYVDNLTVSVNP